MKDLYKKLQETVEFLQSMTDFKPRFGIILGTGLNNLANEIEVIAKIEYKDIINFPISTVQSHKGELIFGNLDGIPIVAMAGRFHYYEGYSMKEVTFPVRVLKMLGIERLIISNVSGSTNENIQAGDIVFIKDHINLQPENPLRGVNDERLGPRFPDMLKTYDRELNAKALSIAKAANIKAHEGVYVGLQGPNLETPAEYVYLNRIGGDVVGMSTVPEVIVARHSNLPLFVLSVVSNQSYPPEVIKETTVEEVIELAKTVEPKMTFVVKEVLKLLNM
ncbi:MAG: purine-nucleoside phosphorylase [Saprospiraceae bacterium]